MNHHRKHTSMALAVLTVIALAAIFALLNSPRAGATTAARQDATQGPPVAEARYDQTNVRVAPDIHAVRLAQIGPGSTYLVLAQYHNWYQIVFPDAPDGVAWVHASSVYLSGDLRAIPPVVEPQWTAAPGAAVDAAPVPTVTPAPDKVDPIIDIRASASTAPPGERLAWTITVLNGGTNPMLAITIQDMVPDALNIEQAETDHGEISIEGQWITVTVEEGLPPGEAITVTIWTTTSESVSAPTQLPHMVCAARQWGIQVCDTAIVVAGADVGGTETLPGARPTPTPIPSPTPNPCLYVVQPGDTLFSIAVQLGVTLDDILAANSTQIDASYILLVGQELQIPGCEGDVSPPPTAEPTATPAGVVIHVVQPGETLASIAQQYGVDPESIIETNNLTTDHVTILSVGQTLIIPLTGDAASAMPPTRTLAPIVSFTPRFTATLSPCATPPGPTITPIPPTPTFTPVASPTASGIVQALETVNLREGPGIDYPVVTTVPPGTELGVLNKHTDDRGVDWYQVVIGVDEEQIAGWITANLIRTDFDLYVTPASLTPTPAAAGPEGVRILAYCRQKNVTPPRVTMADPVVVEWSWYVAQGAPDLMDDHLEHAQYEVRLDGELLEGWQAFATEMQRDATNNWIVYWQYPVGTLDPGVHEITFRLTWDEAVSDGYTMFGPGTANEVDEGNCPFTVTEP